MTKEKNPHAVALGKLGGAKGGKARAAKLTAAERSESAKQAVEARWEQWRRTITIKPAELYPVWASIRLELLTEGAAAGQWSASASRGAGVVGIGPCISSSPRVSLSNLLDKAGSLSKTNRKQLEDAVEAELVKRGL